jgi:N-acyl-D-aspartate/D-glutamate deacylase
MMAQVEGMPIEALECGITWDWRTFSEFLGKFDGQIGVNAAFLVGHCALRRTVMGPSATGSEATPAQVQEMVDLLHESIEAGGFGFSTSLSFTHTDADGDPVPSRYASWEDEVLPLARVVKDHEGTTIEFISDGCVGQFNDDEIDLMTRISAEGQRPLNWNILQIRANNPAHYQHQMQASRRAAEKGAKIVALTMPIIVQNSVSFSTHCGLFVLPGWEQVMRLPIPERIEALKDPKVRERMLREADTPDAGALRNLLNFGRYTIGATFSAANEGLAGRNLGEIAKERGQTPSDALFDIVIADDLQTVLWANSRDDSEESWEIRKRVWNDDYILLGGSDAGAHTDRMCGAGYPMAFLDDCLRGKKLVSVERAVQLMTQAPARHFGLKDRGEIREGWNADLVVIDPARVGSSPPERAQDMPGDSWRLVTVADGVEHVFVNGREIVRSGKLTDQLPGKVLRSGVDSYTVLPNQAAMAH